MWRVCLAGVLVWISAINWTSANSKPNLMLLDVYQGQPLDGWVMSEKLDGVRGFWDGKQLLSRSGNRFNPPDYFIQDFPPFAIDGELFSQRGKFEKISSIIRTFDDIGWQQLKLYVFDVPNAEGDLSQRLQQLADYLRQNPSAYIEIIPQIPIQNRRHAEDFLVEIERLGGEGIVVRNPHIPYQQQRSSQILKFKTSQDEECRVIAHHEGKGRFSGKLGAVSCENQRGVFKIGSGFKLVDRQNPPPIGSLITYQYRGLTKNGKPRFATFLRIRNDNLKKIDE
ncbi:DNA ligase [Testudinibacter sp. TR-2022]|uniref:DNA ligase n=1 Tax=Testudinibacter sp. TR-2022 TaxID=2585029 RepID=UPI001119A297|nr:DNA ligase [Testudinibacter sp. TR-2022]TNH03035.1 DNA ligase [Pasteurellaceae bacterium Phil31]TNH09746.1 DNA ligase [Testudinibacter sp. TR-2022]TNH11133.1 DNA ligase [Testudinibacter sp. TR-2022]TNH15001.1 DNA ligase [Testudinibacter sp. TR-2022]TNH16918.1 DNA ligase [Testudinibacter sp. TR-2022]